MLCVNASVGYVSMFLKQIGPVVEGPVFTNQAPILNRYSLKPVPVGFFGWPLLVGGKPRAVPFVYQLDDGQGGVNLVTSWQWRSDGFKVS